MNRKDFGELTAALRQDLNWTQFQLAEVSGLNVAVVSQIERGVKKHFEPELLFALANAFQLTTLERREFIFAASGLDEKQIVRQASASVMTDTTHPSKVLDKMVALTGEIRVPAFLTDVYSDVLAANAMMLALYEVPPSMIETAGRLPGGYNTARLNFGRELLGREMIKENWDAYALNSMRAFRENSLRYRAWPYFKYLMKAFRNPVEYPLFDRYWKLVSSMEQDKEINIDIFRYTHRTWGSLYYIASATIAVTSFGNLFLIQNLPLDAHTEDIFARLRTKADMGTVRFAPWPDKSMP